MKILSRAPVVFAALLVDAGSSASAVGGPDVFLRVSISCPGSDGTGVLTVTDRNRLGTQSRASYHMENGELREIVLHYARDGVTFIEDMRVDRETYPDAGSYLFNGFEQNARELMRFFCLADQPTRDRYLLLLEENRKLLQQ